MGVVAGVLERDRCILCPSQRLKKAWTFEHHHKCPKCGLIHNLRAADAQGEEARYQGIVFDTPMDVAAQQWHWLKQLGVHPKPGERLLDVGCGSGSFLLEAQNHGLQVFGCDISLDAVAKARQRLGEQAQVERDWEELGSDFDLITLWDVLDHLEEPAQVLQGLKQRLAPNGVIVVRMRNGPLHLLFRNVELWGRRILGRPNGGRCLGVVHRYGFSPSNFERLARLSGFARVEWARRVLTDGQIDRATRQGSWIRPLKRCFSVLADGVASLTGQKLVVNPTLLVLLGPKSGKTL